MNNFFTSTIPKIEIHTPSNINKIKKRNSAMRDPLKRFET